jgi:tetratricopeptide (TPR) repeat protein
LNRNEEAIAFFEKAIRLNKSLASAYNGKALVLDDQKEYKRALRYFNEAIRLDPLNSDFFYNKGFTLDNLNDGDGAIECFK